MQTAGKFVRLTLILGTIAFLSSCRKNPVSSVPQKAQLKLSVGEVTTNEAWLTIGYSNGGTFTMTRDGTAIISGHFGGSDTTVIDDSLIPERTYTYRATIFLGAGGSYSSDPLEVRTMDTTSHDFSWQTFTLGDGNSSMLNDVVIVSDTLIYAVGAIYLKDSTGQFENDPYNLAIWNGKKWFITRTYFYTICGQTALYPYPARTAIELNPNDIWIAEDGNAVVRWHGNSQSAPVCLPSSFTVYKLWGIDTNSVYAVGDMGNIEHYNGAEWQSLSSGTNYLISNIWGVAGKILCVTTESRLLCISGNSVTETLSWSGIPIRGIWFENKTPIYVSGQGVWSNDGRGWNQMSGLPNVFYAGIRGTATNDMFVVASYGTVIHYNGSTWHAFNELANPVWNFQSVALNNDLVVAVGSEAVSIGGLGVVAIGTRTIH